MDELFQLIERILNIVFDALLAYYGTPEGKRAMDSLLADIEAEGVDVPYWTPEGGLELPNHPVAAGEQPDRFAPVLNQAQAWAAQKAKAKGGKS